MKKKMKRKEMKSNIGWKQMRKVVRRKRSVGNEIKDNTKRKGGWRRREIAALRKLCAYSKDRFKVYGRRIIPFIVLVNPEIYTPWFSPFLQPVSLSLSLSPSPLRPPTLSIYLSISLSATLLASETRPFAFNPFSFYDHLLRAV